MSIPNPGAGALLLDGTFTGPAVWPPGSCLQRQDEIPSVVYWLEGGVVKLTRIDADGHEVLLAVKQPPALLGSAFVVIGCPSTHNTITGTNCSLRWCTAELFFDALREQPARLAHVLRLHSLEIVSLDQRLADMAVKTSQERLLNFLEQADDCQSGGPEAAPSPFKHFEIASLIGVTPEHLSRMLKKMAKAGLIGTRGSTIVVLRSQRSARRL